MAIFNPGIYVITKYNDLFYYKYLDSESFDNSNDAINHVKEILGEKLTDKNGFLIIFGNINDEDFVASSIHDNFDDFYKWLISQDIDELNYKFTDEGNFINNFVENFAYNYLEDELFSFSVDDVYDNEITLITDDSKSVYHGEQHEILNEESFNEMVVNLINTDVNNAVESAGFVKITSYDSEYDENDYYGDSEPTGEVRLYIKPVIKNYQKISI